jgi:NADP-dependent 3-hydroxy acid dehydrogenase YdfG
LTRGKGPAVPDSEAGAAGPGALAGMRIVVTGAAQGIGAATVRAYVAAGADVAALDVNAGDGAATAAAADAAGPGTAWFQHCDVSSRSSVQEFNAYSYTIIGPMLLEGT